MPGKFESPKKKFPIIPILIIVIVLIAAVAALWLMRDKLPFGETEPTETEPVSTSEPSEPEPTETEPEPTETEPPEAEPLIVSTASFTVTGDLLMHRYVFQSCWDNEANDWVMDSLFTHIVPYVQEADYAVANLETTLCGPDNGYEYSGNPFFNCPDGIALSAKNTGFDMLLTANNHCYDTRIVGLKRTLDVVEGLGLATLGTQRTAEDPNYTVVDVGGIKVGMTAYTYETPRQGSDLPCINALQIHPNAVGMINSFHYSYLDQFYEEIGAQFDAMRAEGAEAIVVYMHWGEEYHLSPNVYQTGIAQKLCDMGVDVIVGGHPHVIQPVDLLTSTVDENHETLCIYSTGNTVSNQRTYEMDLDTGHTEDGILFNFTLIKYADGSVELLSTSAIPTWVYMAGYRQGYTVLPLDIETQDQWQELFGIDDATYSLCQASYERTMALVESGLTKAQDHFDTVNSAKLEELERKQELGEPLIPEETEPTETEPEETQNPEATADSQEPEATGEAAEDDAEDATEASEETEAALG